MQKLSISQFQGLCKQKLYHEYIYSFENQTAILSSFCPKFCFTDMLISYCVDNSICFYSNENYLQLTSVKHIIVEESSALGVVFTVVCVENSQLFPEISYTFIAR